MTWYIVRDHDEDMISRALMCLVGESTVDLVMAVNPSLGGEVVI